MVLRVKSCCCFISLRRGCICIAVTDLLANVLLLAFADQDKISQLEKAVVICHCIGCIMLLLGALVESTILLMFYLITSIINSIIIIIYFIIYAIHNPSSRVYLMITGFFIISTNSYFYIVVYSYYRQVNLSFEEDEL